MKILSIKEFDRLQKNIQSCQVPCKVCGRKMIIRAKIDRVICDHCGHYVYKDEQTEFKYKMLKEIKKVGKE